MTISEPTISEENKLDEIIASLYTRIQKETDRLLKQQCIKFGIDYDNCKHMIGKCDYPADEFKLADYFLGEQFLLGVRIGSNFMAIEFIIPETHKKEVQHV